MHDLPDSKQKNIGSPASHSPVKFNIKMTSASLHQGENH